MRHVGGGVGTSGNLLIGFGVGSRGGDERPQQRVTLPLYSRSAVYISAAAKTHPPGLLIQTVISPSPAASSSRKAAGVISSHAVE